MSTLDLTGSAHLQRLPTSLETATHKGRFAAAFDYRYQGLAVVCQETSPGTWAVSAYPGLSMTVGGGDYSTVYNDINAADYVFYGGNQYDVLDSNLLSALTTAGYIAAGSGFSAGFDGGFD